MSTLILGASLAACAITLAAPVYAAGAALKHPAPSDSYKSQWYTAPNGCSYSRAQAPGYPPSWHLILNPHHIGQPPAKKSCPPVLGG